MMENHETHSLMNELQTLREEFRQIACFIRELKRDYSVLEEKIELSTADVLHLLGIYQRHHLPDGGRQTLFLTDMYQVIMWSIHSRDSTFL